MDTGRWHQAQAIAEPLNAYWDARGLSDEARGWVDRARVALETADGTPPSLDDPAGALWLFFTLSQADRQITAHHLDAAERTYLDIRDMLQSQPEALQQLQRLADAYHRLGIVAQYRGRLHDAEQWYRQSLTLNKELGNRPGMAANYHHLGIVAQERGCLEDAEQRYRESLTLNKELGNRPGMATNYHHLGWVAQLRGRLEDAEQSYLQSLTINKELGNRPGVASSYHQLGIVAQLRGRLEDAEQWYLQSLTINKELGNRPDMAMSFGQLGLLAETRGRPEEAMEWMVRCVTLFAEFPHPMTGTGPTHLARLTAVLGIDTLERCWHRVTGQPLSPGVRDYLASGPAEEATGTEE